MTFLYDIGNVLLKLHFENFYRKILGASDAAVPPELQTLMDQVEVGTINDHEFVTRSANLFDDHITPETFTEAWQNIFSLNDPMWKVVEQLHAANHRLILFSNTNGVHTTDFLKRFSGFSLFHHHHFSQEIGSAKPHPDFYQNAVDTYRLDPGDTIYFDDLDENIATGKEFGFHSWQYDYRDHEACLRWLEKSL